jgi:4-hydroxy-3-polyprenylbenzoate decarboxylase
MKLIVAITGASGVELGFKLISNIPKDVEIHLVISNSAKLTLNLENEKHIKDLISQDVILYNDKDIGASIASGSFGADKMIIVPCSMNTLAKCANGISDTLITRAFYVMLKEKRDIILTPREIPFPTISLEQMTKLSSYGVIIAPPVLGYYSGQKTLEEMEDFLIGKWLDLLKIPNTLYKRWNRNEKSNI